MRYSLALYCSDLTDSTSDYRPVGVLVVNENSQKYSFKHLSPLYGLDFMTTIIWKNVPAILEQRFNEYQKEPNHDFYRERLDEYYGFISQLIDEWSQSNICFSNSMSIEENGSVELISEKLFKQKVLRRLD
ncbi:MAG: hypothetical protein A3D44_01305 [Candidatus Staskawiczbacteria bacterium RIFCSPHIGHO2_02_FULL_42_22]|uniref:Uncharacterized protein n=1 Tax=Candidatus Staskawiczbacteria bacterium RIFCSPHIGHO2_02_FULL_42_22 TaxID=1802207 RepID=A0A1G2I4H1_9BACT|nr:MAG: hypothetical protein A3D44_01305 [Candidatus Staskawiczbacteria bacterium RIFCSPHIGHO2_02_FULL_42_22]